MRDKTFFWRLTTSELSIRGNVALHPYGSLKIACVRNSPPGSSLRFTQEPDRMKDKTSLSDSKPINHIRACLDNIAHQCSTDQRNEEHVGDFPPPALQLLGSSDLIRAFWRGTSGRATETSASRGGREGRKCTL